MQQNGAQAILVVEHQGEALIGGNTAGETDCQHRGIQQLGEPGRVADARVLFLPCGAHPQAGIRHELVAHPTAHVPQLSVTDHLRRPVAGRRVRGAELVRRKFGEQRIGPGGRVHAVRYRGDGDILGVKARPECPEHSSRHLTVQPRNTVRTLPKTQAHDGHVEGVGAPALVVLRAKRHNIGNRNARQEVGREITRDKSVVEAIDASRDGSVRRKHSPGANDL